MTNPNKPSIDNGADTSYMGEGFAYGYGVSGFEHIEPVALPVQTIDGIEARTNLPPDIAIFEPVDTAEHPFYRAVLPSAADQLPAGEYRIGHPDNDDRHSEKVITVFEDRDGKFISGAFRRNLVDNVGGSRKLMQKLGFTFGQDKASPTPETFKAMAGELGLAVRLIPGVAIIPEKDYLQAFKDGEYPVATGSEEYYAHDTTDNHATAMVLGGKPLMDALSGAAARALEKKDVNLGKVAAIIDDFTEILRGVIAPTDNSESEYAYTENSLGYLGKQIGISRDEIQAIVATARQNAENEGMQVRE